jgi:FXSXX-COOH protein
MGIEAGDIGSYLIDLTGLSLQDLVKLPESSLALALREVLTSNGAGSSAGFSSSLRDSTTVVPLPPG